ncbi:MAG: diaminopimelate epimerase [Alphaproteobacteria bacterium]
MDPRPFLKMHGLGNDFVIVDGRARTFKPSPTVAARISDRHFGVGCDQLIVLEKSLTGLADATMKILNADGSESASCGNATRCVATLLMQEFGREHVVIETAAGLLDCDRVGDLVTVDMGPARLDWNEIPIAEKLDTLHLGIREGMLVDPVGVSMGNPHAVFMVDDAASVPLDRIGPKIERHKLFPQRTNVEAVQVLSRNKIRLRVWERGAGITLACGSGACAALVATARRNLTDRKAEVVLDGGSLVIEWLGNGHVLMTGPVATAFRGELDPSLLKE